MKLKTPPRINRPRNISVSKLQSEKVRQKANKSLQTGRKRKISIQMKTNFKISPSHLNFLIEEQRQNDLKQIKASIGLHHYYETMMSLFMIIYSSSQIITSNIFDCKKQTTGLAGLKFIGILFQLYENQWNSSQLVKLRVMARNVMKMGKTPKIFEQRVEFICRKITLNHNMQKRIEMAFLNVKLQSFWQKIRKKFQFSEEVEMLEDMYELAPEKMAYWDFQRFLNWYLCDEEFYDTLRASTQKKKERNLDEEVYQFTYEFVIIEIFCFYEELEESQSSMTNSCALI